jgi:hypothetical protein
LDQGVNHAISKYELILFNSCLLNGPAQKMSTENLLFLHVCVTGQLDLLHTVDQGFGDVLLVVGRTYEQHVRQVDWNVHEVVDEA